MELTEEQKENRNRLLSKLDKKKTGDVRLISEQNLANWRPSQNDWENLFGGNHRVSPRNNPYGH
jgi:hypothetical protein